MTTITPGRLILQPDVTYGGSGLSPGHSMRTFIAIILVMLSLYGCDSERDKAWKKWRAESDKFDYRCGTFNGYEFKINRAYLFFWPTYEGRSDWEAQGPPPLSCGANLETMPMEAYWPGMSAAGTYSEESVADPNRIHISLNSVPNLNTWDLVLNLEYRFGKDWKQTLPYQKNKDNLGLNYIESPSWPFPDEMIDYYWVEEPDGRISIFIICDTYNPNKQAVCDQTEYIPEMHAILEIKYKKSRVRYWKSLSSDVREFINERTRLKRK